MGRCEEGGLIFHSYASEHDARQIHEKVRGDTKWIARSLARSALSLFDCAGRSGVRSAARSWEGLVSVQSLHDLLVHSRWRHCSTANNGKPEAGLSMTVVDP